MSVVLASIPADGDAAEIEVSASNYDAGELVIEQTTRMGRAGLVTEAITVTRRQLQELCRALDRFADR